MNNPVNKVTNLSRQQNVKRISVWVLDVVKVFIKWKNSKSTKDQSAFSLIITVITLQSMSYYIILKLLKEILFPFSKCYILCNKTKKNKKKMEEWKNFRWKKLRNSLFCEKIDIWLTRKMFSYSILKILLMGL